MNQKSTNKAFSASEHTSYLDLDVASRADTCLVPQHVSSVYTSIQRTSTTSTVL